ncbi:hypothetical protein [Vibrio parahaemolyticus]|uniref:hypothetical protein n=1 Tax=Vibrio parahaemolyticus TaxID=670 RepID=UPI0011202F80|nr:hypothetical protein [Vibrio parahaemolyticus]MBE3844778.1 hypothetical protein [Vibrio parahaemolyticus]MBE3945820.1 hypothetical protein [Vibrio parahaemolyticus]MBE4781618.1 hypothetical protein [Vibrio parahaemolyticus]MEA5290681.1 hypothetical protein [Vibrio parahaemolyticus]TOE36287.1 hypothetical protein CGJ44_24790 [Vibrio parahaemolyticus]
MTIHEIQQQLHKIQSAQNSADRDELIYDLGDFLGWTISQTNIFYDIYDTCTFGYEAKDLLPTGSIQFIFEMRAGEAASPI